MKKSFFSFIVITLLSASCTAQSSPTNPYTTPLTIGTKQIFVQTVSSTEDMQKGLSNREQLRNDQGMLFDFRNSQNRRPRFWMKDMKFDLDLIWIKNNKIIGITKNVMAPIENWPTYSPPSDIDMVLEVNSGWSDEYKIKTGDGVRF